ncbi:MAG TPA: pantetheine-phosphate adenylyltransferase [Spirochaetota bacterium]|nr:pantetheine-phosphate adenylyltransferase [Spirochaetota bacterium]HNT10605.1 pantetheine-phosphate adenylyltransferase [Spirochaetota bacterium]HNV49156.1 pantetheine-phosphate adenylyltransferase [Spirochaetota bacterium]HOS41475.1 pantetheine-phosphate adenylyltransferase [Spirochaetota bacterium]HPU89358.1 pantetheine-phosphate adenylyltransferase [Spirochaetota bacterium]
MMRIGIYPGSFDPLTNGHLDIIERAKRLCDRLIIAVARNSSKKPLFSIEERMDMLRACCDTGDNTIEVATFDGLLVDFCKNSDVSFIVRGLRAIVDFDYEYAIALLNRQLAPDIDTIFLMTKGEYSFISSNIVREVASYGGDVSSFVPQFVQQRLQEKLSS